MAITASPTEALLLLGKWKEEKSKLLVLLTHGGAFQVKIYPCIVSEIVAEGPIVKLAGPNAELALNLVRGTFSYLDRVEVQEFTGFAFDLWFDKCLRASFDDRSVFVFFETFPSAEEMLREDRAR